MEEESTILVFATNGNVSAYLCNKWNCFTFLWKLLQLESKQLCSKTSDKKSQTFGKTEAEFIFLLSQTRPLPANHMSYVPGVTFFWSLVLAWDAPAEVHDCTTSMSPVQNVVVSTGRWRSYRRGETCVGQRHEIHRKNPWDVGKRKKFISTTDLKEFKQMVRKQTTINRGYHFLVN